MIAPHKARRRWLEMFKDEAANVAMLFALCLVPMSLAAGSALDLVQSNDVRTKLQSALDAAALAAASAGDLDDAARQAIAAAAFDKNFISNKTANVSVTPIFEITGSTVQASAVAVRPTLLMQLAGIDEMELGARTSVAIPSAKQLEISLVLDYSGSMTETVGVEVKYQAMAAAASSLVTDLSSTGNVKFALVPFSHHVYLTMPSKYVMGQPTTGTWTGCTQDRRYPQNLTGATPDAADDTTKWGQEQAPVHSSDGCSSYSPNKLTLLPLTDDSAAVTTRLAEMRPYKWTHISLGMEFGWQSISPDGIYADTVAPYNDPDTSKWIVLLTDGAQTEPAFGSGTTRTVSQGERNLESLCEGIKEKGVKIIAIAYDLDDNSTVTRLRDCASNDNEGEAMFYRAGGTTTVSEVFDDLKKQLTQAIYISK